VVHACNPGSLGSRHKRIKGQGHPRQNAKDLISKKSRLWWFTPVIPAIMEVLVQGRPKEKVQTPYLKNRVKNKEKKTNKQNAPN
jgi:hypothetical protein